MIAAMTNSTVTWCQVSTLNFVDLAGSERSSLAAKDDGDNKLRQTEGSAINKSLLTLGNVIRGLGDGRVSAHLLSYAFSTQEQSLKTEVTRKQWTLVETPLCLLCMSALVLGAVQCW